MDDGGARNRKSSAYASRTTEEDIDMADEKELGADDFENPEGEKPTHRGIVRRILRRVKLCVMYCVNAVLFLVLYMLRKIERRQKRKKTRLLPESEYLKRRVHVDQGTSREHDCENDDSDDNNDNTTIRATTVAAVASTSKSGMTITNNNYFYSLGRQRSLQATRGNSSNNFNSEGPNQQQPRQRFARQRSRTNSDDIVAYELGQDGHEDQYELMYATRLEYVRVKFRHFLGHIFHSAVSKVDHFMTYVFRYRSVFALVSSASSSSLSEVSQLFRRLYKNAWILLNWQQYVGREAFINMVSNVSFCDTGEHVTNRSTTMDGSNTMASSNIAGRRRKTLVLDLDETLVHAQMKRPVDGYDLELNVHSDNAFNTFFVSKRPHLDAFLRCVSKWYRIVIFTASSQRYADPLIDAVDQYKVVEARFFRESCIQKGGQFIKDLTVVEPDLRNVILLDNTPSAYAMHAENGLPIEAWFNDPYDEHLLDLLPLLYGLHFLQDVRSILSLRITNGMLHQQLKMNTVASC